MNHLPAQSLQSFSESLAQGIAERLREAMQARNIRTQARLSKLSGVPQPTISRVLLGNHGAGPELETSRKLAKATCVHLIWLQEGTGPRDLDDILSGSPQGMLDLSGDEGFDFARFGDRLTYGLSVRGLRQVTLADELGITRAAVSQLCNSGASEGGGRYAQEISEFVGVDMRWLCFGEGEPNFQPPIAGTASNNEKASTQPAWPPNGLSALQCATLENLVKVMQSGGYNDMACLELLQQLKPALEKLS